LNNFQEIGHSLSPIFSLAVRKVLLNTSPHTWSWI